MKRLLGVIVLSLSELTKTAEVLWIREAQISLVIDPEFENWKRQLGLFLDSTDMWRCGGRLHHADLPYSSSFPVLLPRNHQFTTLIIHRAHECVFHNGVKETLMDIRANFWILKGRSAVKQCIRRCVICCRFEGPSYSDPTPPLYHHFE